MTLTNTFSGDDRLVQVDYSSGPRRTLSYHPEGQLWQDQFWSSSAQTTLRYETVYGDYDLNGNVLAKTVGPAGVAGAGTHAYVYDKGGRLTSWTAPGQSATVYDYDLAGNRTRAGSTYYRYDARNRLCYSASSNANVCGSTPAGGTAYAWSARGTMASAGGVNATFDAFGRAITAGGSSYSYDSLDRVAARGATQFKYEGVGMDPIDDGTNLVSHGAGGTLFGHKTGTSSRLAITNGHNDLVGFLNGTSLSESFNYSPFGDPAGQTGTIDPNVGFQGDFTDPATGQVWMGARWYQPGIGGFTSRDSYAGDTRTPVSLNRYTYANNNPARFWDPSGFASADSAEHQIDDCAGSATVTTGPAGPEAVCGGTPAAPKNVAGNHTAGVVTKQQRDGREGGGTINVFHPAESSSPVTTPTYDCVVGCDNAQLNDLDEVKDWLENDPTGQFVFAVIDGCNRMDASKVDGNWSTHDVECAATGMTEDDGEQDVRKLISAMIDQGCQSDWVDEVCGEGKAAIVDFVAGATNDIGEFFRADEQFESRSWEDIDYEKTFLERHSWLGGLVTLGSVLLAVATFVTPCTVACAVGAATLATWSAADSCSGGGDHSTQCGIGVVSAGLAWTGAGSLASSRALGAGSNAAGIGAETRLGLEGIHPIAHRVTGPALRRTSAMLSSGSRATGSVAENVGFAGLVFDIVNSFASSVRAANDMVNPDSRPEIAAP